MTHIVTQHVLSRVVALCDLGVVDDDEDVGDWSMCPLKDPTRH